LVSLHAESPPPLFPPAMDASEVRLSLEKLNVLGRVLYLAAHPDDENTNLIALWSNGSLYEAAYLSVTRGDGGQNLIGSELREKLGLIRTEELLAARRIDHGQQFAYLGSRQNFVRCRLGHAPLSSGRGGNAFQSGRQDDAWPSYRVSHPGAGSVYGGAGPEALSGAAQTCAALAAGASRLEYIAVFLFQSQYSV
jgi:hypothetical protein